MVAGAASPGISSEPLCIWSGQRIATGGPRVGSACVIDDHLTAAFGQLLVFESQVRSRRGSQSRSESKSNPRRRSQSEQALAAAAGAVDRTVFITGRFGGTHCVGRRARGGCLLHGGPWPTVRSVRTRGGAAKPAVQVPLVSGAPPPPGPFVWHVPHRQPVRQAGVLERHRADQRMRSVSFHVKPETVVPPPVATDHTRLADLSDG
jgi:hypothetical protein